MMARIAKLRLRWARGAELEGMSQRESEAEGERRVLEEYGLLRGLGRSRETGLRGVTRRPVEGIELAIQGVGTVVWEAGGRWDEGGQFSGKRYVDRFGELWKVSAAGGRRRRVRVWSCGWGVERRRGLHG